MTVPYTTSYNGTVPFSDTTANFGLQAGVAQSYTVPGLSNSKYSVRFSFTENSNVFIGYNATAVSPTLGTPLTTNYIEFRPHEERYVKGGDVLSLITPDTSAYMGLSLRAIPG